MEVDADPRDTPRRKYFSSLESALNDLEVPPDNMALAREVGRRVPHDTIYIPLPSRQYVALKSRGGSMAPHIDRTFAWIRGDLAPALEGLAETGLGWCKVQFPVGVQRDASAGRRRRPEALNAPVCDGCNQQLPVTGICDNCD